MPLDYSTFSISNALCLLSPWRSSATTTTVAPQEPSFAEQESCPSYDQQNQHDVDIMSCQTPPQHQQFISPQHSFSHASQGYALPRSDPINNTSSHRGYQENCLQAVLPLGSWVAIHQPQQSDLIHLSAEIALGPEEQSASQDQPSEAANPIIYSSSMSPLFYLDYYGDYQHSFPGSHPSTDQHVARVSAPIEPISAIYSPAAQGSFQSNSQECQQLNFTRASPARSSRPSHDVRASTQLPLHPSSDPPHTSLGKRSRETSCDADIVGLDTTTKAFRQASNSSIKRSVPVPHAPRMSEHPRAQHENDIPRMGIAHTAPRKVECGGRMVDECTVHNAMERGQPLLHVYECKWGKNHSPCGMYIEGDQSSVTDHLLRFHNFTGGEENTACLWDGCRSKRRTAMKGTSIARHLVTHIGHKVQCTACNTEFAREDACRRSHSNVRSRCRTMQMDPVHGAGVTALELQNRVPVAKKRRRADS